MILILKKNPETQEYKDLKAWLEAQHVIVKETIGEERIVWGLLGDTSEIDADRLGALKIVESVKRMDEPYKKASRHFHQEDTVIRIGNCEIGGKDFCSIAGPCSVETADQIREVALSVAKSGANMLRGGAFKPRTSPYSFQGKQEEGIRLLELAKKESGLPIVTEIMEISQLPLFENIDVIQVGARNMQNYALLKELGMQDKPVLLKRGMNATYEEWLMSAEYIMAEGNEQVILCERGIRTFETYTRNTLDLTAVPALKRLTHLPIIVDPSHGTGKAELVPDMAMASVACGAHGVMVEVHNNPEHAWSDGAQSIDTCEFANLNSRMKAMYQFMQE
ncbi:MAG: 3-deoxy-7-phosphoheptulonate synthase [Lachnospiraceae bacterium]|jgi:3-deoxy-7-phosphoheptulonate synthase|nr:3-deoxy-7-phosphoheptulonate synthase [Lachnospiraceae bacterium]